MLIPCTVTLFKQLLHFFPRPVFYQHFLWGAPSTVTLQAERHRRAYDNRYHRVPRHLEGVGIMRDTARRDIVLDIASCSVDCTSVVSESTFKNKIRKLGNRRQRIRFKGNRSIARAMILEVLLLTKVCISTLELDAHILVAIGSAFGVPVDLAIEPCYHGVARNTRKRQLISKHSPRT